MFETRVPPHNLDAEQSVLGAMILEKEAAYQALELLIEDDFYRTSHKKIFGVICNLLNQNEPVDIITLSDELNSQGIMEEIGGYTYLTTLVNTVPTAANLQYHARIIKEKAILRNLISVSTEIVRESYEIPDDVDEFVDKAEQLIFEVARDTSSKSFIQLREILMETLDRIGNMTQNKSGVTGIPTGFVDFDEMTSGLQESDLVILAARPSMGKTTLALNMAQHIAVKEKLPVAFFSMEMSQNQLAQRMLCSQAHVDSQKLRNGFLSKDDWPKLTQALGPLDEAELYIDDTAGQTVMEIRAKARRLKAEKGLSAIFIDYLQLMSSHGKSENRQQELSDISRSLKALAKELNIPVLALSQLSRAVEKRTDRRPILSDLMESGGIEANADMVVFIYREDYYVEEAEKKNIAEIKRAKQRNGPIGTVELLFMDNFVKFENLSHEYSSITG